MKVSSTIRVLLTSCIVTVTAFTTQRSSPLQFRKSLTPSIENVPASSTFPNCIASTETSTALNERRWNFNEARGPWGMKRNAEVWNGRIAQMGFAIVLVQEVIFGKGVVAGLQDGDFGAKFSLGFTVVSVLVLSAWLAFKGKENDIVY